MHELNILTVGSSTLSEDYHELCFKLGANLVSSNDTIYLNSGGLCGYKTQSYYSSDFYIAEGAKQFLRNSIDGPKQRILTYNPMQEYREGAAERFFFGIDVQSVNIINKPNRPLELCEKADLIISICGGSGTYKILQQANQMQIPILPISFTGGSSAEIWRDLKHEIIESFSLTKPEVKKLEKSNGNAELVSELIVRIINRKKRKWIFVANETSGNDSKKNLSNIKRILSKDGYFYLIETNQFHDSKYQDYLQQYLQKVCWGVFLADDEIESYKIGYLHAKSIKTVTLHSNYKKKFPLWFNNFHFYAESEEELLNFLSKTIR